MNFYCEAGKQIWEIIYKYVCQFQAELNSRVFINSIVIVVTGVIGYTLAGSLITVIGKKKLMGKTLMK